MTEALTVDELVDQLKAETAALSNALQDAYALADALRFGVVRAVMDGAKDARILSNALRRPTTEVERTLRELRRLGFVVHDRGSYQATLRGAKAALTMLDLLRELGTGTGRIKL